jgi:hypothetical protein
MARFDSEAGVPISEESLLDLQFVIPEWTEQAACIGRWDIFDGMHEGSGRVSNARLAQYAEAKRICTSECPVMSECLADALKDEIKTYLVDGNRTQLYTIRGGLDASERLEIIKASVPTRR